MHSNLGASTATSSVAGIVVGGAIIGMYMGGTVVKVLIDNKLLGYSNKHKNWKSMAKNAAFWGGVFGSIPALLYGGVTFFAVKAT
jgi:hypothetical protein